MPAQASAEPNRRPRDRRSAHAPPRANSRAPSHRCTRRTGPGRATQQSEDVWHRRRHPRRQERGADIVNGANEYGGVYLPRRGTKPIAAVHFSFVSTGDVGGGAPRFSIPIDTDHNRTVEGYAFLDVNNCGSVFVSTDSATCKVYFLNEVFNNWDAFVAAHPKYRIPPGAIPFVIADVPGSYSVRSVDLR